jgi:glycosyltransferase involved in cell wall biosynthesis
VDAVLAQKDVTLRVLVVDDGGADDTVAAVEALGHPNVSTIRHPTSQGAVRARNPGIRQVRTPWVPTVEDDIWAPVAMIARSLVGYHTHLGMTYGLARAHLHRDYREVGRFLRDGIVGNGPLSMVRKAVCRVAGAVKVGKQELPGSAVTWADEARIWTAAYRADQPTPTWCPRLR